MPISYSQLDEIECPDCHAAFHVEVWLIIDAAERSDLAARCRDGSIFRMVCPSGHVYTFGTPMLYHDAERELLLLAVPPGMGEYQARRVNSQLMPKFLASLGPGGEREYLQETVVVPQDLLPKALSEPRMTNAHPVSERRVDDHLEGVPSLMEEAARLARLSEMPRKIELVQRALSLVRREQDPPLWASLTCELAKALSQTPNGDRAENLEGAIACLGQALEVYTRAGYPEHWARVQYNLAAAFGDRIVGDRAENVEEAISHYDLALQVLAREAYPEQWAMTQNGLAGAYATRVRGDRAENLEHAIVHLKQALQVFTNSAYPDQWAMTQNNLALVYSGRIRGERAQNLEQAIFNYKQALQVRTREVYPEEWALTQNNLANIYSNRICGERGENLEQALVHLERALQVYARTVFPEDWATT